MYKEYEQLELSFNEQNNEEGLFAPELPALNPWKILVVDDEQDIHVLTQFVLDDYVYQGRTLEFISAYSSQEAQTLLAKYNDIAIILLDVVMETHDAGLRLVEYIRNTLYNRFVRIILRTGQPGYAPEKKVILEYDINDYKNKTELTDQKLFTAITASLRAYSDIIELEIYRQHLADKVAERTYELSEKNEVLSNLNQTLKKLNEEKTEFLKIASMDIKNPLSSIQELSVLIQRAFEKLSKQEIINLIHIIEVSSQRMVSVIRNLLVANALESDTMELSMGVFDFRHSLRFLIDDYSIIAREKNVHLHFKFPEEEYKLFVNKKAILQILDHLISNAIQSSPFGKDVHVKIGQQGRFMQCRIQDEGNGISEENRLQLLERISLFTPQLEGQKKIPLGLFIVKKLVEAMSGRLWYESEPGQGTTFIVEFPLVETK